MNMVMNILVPLKQGIFDQLGNCKVFEEDPASWSKICSFTYKVWNMKWKVPLLLNIWQTRGWELQTVYRDVRISCFPQNILSICILVYICLNIMV